MPVKIRLTRRGRKKLALYDVVVADSRAPRDGRFIEKLGTYNPNTNPASINLDENKAFDWVMKGAQPTDTVRAILSYRGVMMRKHLQVGVNKGAITQEEADKKMEAWLTEKLDKIQGKVDRLTKEKDAKAKAKLEAETKVKEARTEALLKRKKEAEAALVAEIKGEEATEEVAEAPASDEEAPQDSAAQTAETVEEAEAPAATEEPAAEVKEEPTAEAKEEPKAEEPKEEDKKEE